MTAKCTKGYGKALHKRTLVSRKEDHSRVLDRKVFARVMSEDGNVKRKAERKVYDACLQSGFGLLVIISCEF